MKNRLVALLTLSSVVTPSISFAQDAAYLEKIERRLMAMEQKIYNAPQGTSGGGNPAMMADFEARLQQLEEESSKVYGAVEELGNTVEKFAKKMELISKDFDLRLQDIEGELEKGLVPASSAQAPVAMPDPKLKGKFTDRVAGKGKEEKQPESKAVAQTSAKPSTSLSGFPEGMDVKAHYDQAYKLIIATQYEDAQKAMSLFLERHGDHELADNAYYWLGEVYLVQDQPEKAVITFSKGLAKFPKGAKAAGNLLKMGVAFKRMKKNDYAKSSWEKLINDYPNSAEAGKAKKELKSL